MLALAQLGAPARQAANKRTLRGSLALRSRSPHAFDAGAVRACVLVQIEPLGEGAEDLSRLRMFRWKEKQGSVDRCAARGSVRGHTRPGRVDRARRSSAALTHVRPPRVADSRTLVCKGMFGKHTDLTPFLRMRVTVGPDSVVRARRGGECCYAR